MSVEIIHDSKREIAALICNTDMEAFGPIFTGPGCAEDAADFLDWLQRNPQPIYMNVALQPPTASDPRQFSEVALEEAHERWQEADDRQRGVEA